MSDYLMTENEIRAAKNQRKMGFELLPKLLVKQKHFAKELKRLEKDFAREFKALELQKQRQNKQAENLRQRHERQINALKQKHDKQVAILKQKMSQNAADLAYYESITSGTASPESVYEAFKQRQNDKANKTQESQSAQKERI